VTLTARAFLIVLALVTAVSCRRSEPRFDIRTRVSADLLRSANHGRDVFRRDGRFALPEQVTRVWVDVGAHLLETTGEAFESEQNLGLVAVEPQAQCWQKWPDNPRLAALPVALFLVRGTMDFNVNADDETSSLAATVVKKNSRHRLLDEKMKTVEVRKVPVLRLEDVLAAIPDSLEIEYLKTDVQGVDLQVIQSAGEQLRRVHRVRVEVINAPYYANLSGHKPMPEQEMVAHMRKMGFEFVADHDVQRNRTWMDKDFVNTRFSAKRVANP
jgi:FkbM family methyltransferase